METRSSRANASEIHPVSTGAGTVLGASVRPGRVSAAPPKGGGNTPNTLGDGGNPAPEVRGLLRRNPPFAPQEFASAASAASNVSKRLMLPSGDVVDVPTGLDARLDRWGNVAYRVVDGDVVLRLVAELLLYVVRSYRGSVVRLDGRRISRLLGLRQRGGVSGYLEPYSMSRIYGILSMLGFELSRSNHRITITIDLRKPIMREIKRQRH
ncbi:MAG: hypothetical protein RQ842_10600 [Vulcanisaeta sp.]|nr:hypothetical protein [Vulcanisaeta sp.]